MRSEIVTLRRQLFALSALGAPMTITACGSKGEGDTGAEWCGFVQEAEVGGEPAERALYCFDDAALSADGCPTIEGADRLSDELLAPYLGDADAGGVACSWWGEFTCGPARREGERCCYVVESPSKGSCSVPGRPFLVRGMARRASVNARPAWSAGPASPLPDPPPGARARLAALWSRSARAEHASVAAFARASLRLLGLGAPPELLRDTASAMADEVEHARLSFQIASTLAGRPVGPRALDVSDALHGADGPEAVLVETLREGCIGESLSAAEARIAAVDAHPEIARSLMRIAEDETRHAALAWRTAAWILSADPSLCAVARRALVAQPPPKERDPLPGPILARFGLLSAARAAEVRAATLSTVVGPLASALLRAGSASVGPRPAI